MIMKNLKFIATAIAMATVSGIANSQTIVTKISGEVIGDTTIHSVTILKEGQHPLMSPKTEVPVVDGKFSHEMQSDYPEAYYIMPGTNIWQLDGSWLFFSEGGELKFEIQPGDNLPNVTRKTALPFIERLQRYWESIDSDPDYIAYSAFTDSLYDNGLFYTQEYADIEKRLYDSPTDESIKSQLRSKLDSLKNSGRDITPDGKKSREWGERLSEKWEKENIEFVANDSSICGLFMIVRNMWIPNADNHEEYIRLYTDIYKDKFKDHPYATEIDRIIPVYRKEATSVGRKYTDVEALDVDGKMKYISSFIEGKVALIDLWASWCSPCRRNSKSLIPIYKKYNPKGFEIIGIAREMGDDKALRKAVEKDGYPWTSLAEINDRNMIWTLFGTPNAPGRTVLVDRDGIIIAIDPTVEELEKKLSELLNVTDRKNVK